MLNIILKQQFLKVVYLKYGTVSLLQHLRYAELTDLMKVNPVPTHQKNKHYFMYLNIHTICVCCVGC